jgi:hypothetical protein
MDPNQIETLITVSANARKSCETADANWLGYLHNAREQALRVAAQLKDAQHLADTERARLRTETDRVRAELAEAHAELAKVRRQIERDRHEIGIERKKLLNTIQSLEGRVA